MSSDSKVNTVSPRDARNFPSPELLKQLALCASYRAKGRGSAPASETEGERAAEAEQPGSTTGA